MSQDRPEEFRFDIGIGRIIEIYPRSWEVDIEAEDGGVVQRAIVVGPRLPEKSNDARPQWCVFGFASHLHGRAVCWPIESRLPAARTPRADVVHYDEVLNFRTTIDRAGNLEIRNAKGGRLLQIRIKEDGGVVRLDTPTTRVVLNDDAKSIEVHCDETLTATCKNATVTADQNVDVTAGGNANVKATGSLTLKAASIQIEATGAVVIKGTTVDLNPPAVP